MYRSFSIKNFRLFKDFRLDGLKRVNLIAGVNNVGKTALLEALYVHGNAPNINFMALIDVLRSQSPTAKEPSFFSVPAWASCFLDFDTQLTIVLYGAVHTDKHCFVRLREIRDREELVKLVAARTLPSSLDRDKVSSSFPQHTRVLELEYDCVTAGVDNETREPEKYYWILDPAGVHSPSLFPPPEVKVTMLSEFARRGADYSCQVFSALHLKNQHQVVVESLQGIEPRLTRLSVDVVANKPILHGDLGTGRLIPLPLMGGGIAAVADMVLALSDTRDGVLLVDEIDNGIHHSALGGFWKKLDENSKRFNVQVFATTHSLECIRAAHFAFEESEEYDFRLIRLDRIDDRIEPLWIDEEMLDTAIEANLEVR